MKNIHTAMIPVYAISLLAFIICGVLFGKAATAFSESMPLENRHCFIIDAGHGGVDGGAISCTGAYESHINLEIAIKLNNLMQLLGYETKMIRASDISVYTSGRSIGEKKASDLKERVRIVNETPNAILLSIHQNHYFDSYYSGAQMFYPNTSGSRLLAEKLQEQFNTSLNIRQKRQAKQAEGLYLMKNIDAPGVLIECGFLSNPQEEQQLRSSEHQLKICAIIATVCANCLTGQGIADII